MGNRNTCLGYLKTKKRLENQHNVMVQIALILICWLQAVRCEEKVSGRLPESSLVSPKVDKDVDKLSMGNTRNC